MASNRWCVHQTLKCLYSYFSVLPTPLSPSNPKVRSAVGTLEKSRSLRMPNSLFRKEIGHKRMGLVTSGIETITNSKWQRRLNMPTFWLENQKGHLR